MAGNILEKYKTRNETAYIKMDMKSHEKW